MKRMLCLLFAVMMMVFMVSVSAITASAASNPYPTSQTINGVTTVPCTWYAWQQAFDNMGVTMPNFGNAKNWYTSAQNNGYSVGSEARPNSIAVWTNSGYGHVAYVVSVNGATMKVNEGGMYNINGSAMNGNGIINGSTCNSTVGSNKSAYSSSVLVGFIYLTNSIPSNITVTNDSSKNSIDSDNAILYGRVDKPSSSSISKIGIKIWKDGASEGEAFSKFDTPSRTYVGHTYMYVYYDLKSELNVTLVHATKYIYKIYAQIDGVDYWSNETSFTTTGSHSYGLWNTTVAATCKSQGTRVKSCSCGEVITEKIAAIGHSYKNNICTNCGDRVFTFGWNLDNGNWCYVNEDGRFATNMWKQDSEGWCYLGADGYCVTNCWVADSIGWCYLDDDGRMVTNKWVMDSIGWCYLGADGYCVTNCWMADSFGWCYLDASGRMVSNAWVMDSVGWCYLGADGYCVTNCWMADSFGWCFLNNDGRMVTNAWVMDSVGWCYLGADGYCVTNSWMADSVGWCYLDADGRMIVGRTIFVDGGWYTFDHNGYWVSLQ